MPAKRALKMQGRDRHRAIEIPATPEPEDLLPNKAEESISNELDSLDYPCAQLPIGHPYFKKLYDRVLGS